MKIEIKIDDIDIFEVNEILDQLREIRQSIWTSPVENFVVTVEGKEEVKL